MLAKQEEIHVASIEERRLIHLINVEEHACLLALQATNTWPTAGQAMQYAGIGSFPE